MSSTLIVGIIAAVAALVTLFLSAKKKALATITALVTAICLFIDFPNLLSSSFAPLGTSGVIIVGLLGFIVTLLAVLPKVKQVPPVLLIVGVVVVTWAAFRLMPSFPPAFENLGRNLKAPSMGVGKAIVEFVQSLFKK